MIRNYKNIVAWQRTHKLTLAVYKLTKRFPDDERFGLTRQVRRAAYGAPANIAEGSGRDTTKDYLRFLYIALVSLKETEYFLLLAHDLGYLSDSDYEPITNQVNMAFGVLQGLIKSVKKEAGVVGTFTAKLSSAIAITVSQYTIAPH